MKRKMSTSLSINAIGLKSVKELGQELGAMKEFLEVDRYPAAAVGLASPLEQSFGNATLVQVKGQIRGDVFDDRHGCPELYSG